MANIYDYAAASSAGLEDEAADRGEVLTVELVDLIKYQVRGQESERLDQEARVDRRGHPHEMVDRADQDRRGQQALSGIRVFTGVVQDQIAEGGQATLGIYSARAASPPRAHPCPWGRRRSHA